MNKKYMKRMLGFVLSLVLLVSSVIVSPPQVALAESDGKVELHYRADGDGKVNFDVDDFSDVPTGYYKVSVKVDGTIDSQFILEHPDWSKNTFLRIWDFTQGGGKVPETGFVISEGAVLEPVVANTWTTDTTRSSVTMKNKLVMNKTASGAWEEVTEALDEVELHYRATGEGTYNFDVDDMSKVATGYYKVKATVDGTTEAYVAIENPAYLNNQYMVVWNFTTLGAPNPTTSFTIAKGAVLEPIDPNNSWATDISRSKLSMKSTLMVSNESGTWAEKKLEDIELHYRATGDGVFNFDVDDMSKVPVGYYKLNVKVDGTTDTHFLIENASYLNNAYVVIWDCKWDGGVEPTTSIEIAEGAELEPVVATTWTADTTRSRIKIKNALTITKESGTWAEKVTQPEQPTQSENLKLTFESIFGEALNFQFAWEMSDGATPQNGFYRAEAVIDGTSSKVLIEFTENYFWIYPHCFSETPGSASQYPKATFSIAEGTTLTPVSSSTWSEDSSRKTYKLSAKVDMAYTDGEWTDIGNQGGTVVEKDPISLKISYNRMFDKHFAFDGELSGGSKPEDGWYRTDAVIDGKSTKICMEYVDGFFFIYSQCFYEMPSDTNTQYPTKSVYIAKDATLTPIKAGSWAKDVTGQPYTLNTKVDLVLSDDTWMDADYKAKIDNMTPLKVNIVFSNISGSAMIFKVVTSNGKSISDIYGDWTTAVGELKKGTLDEATKKYTYEKSQAYYSITGETFYVDSLGLSKLDGIQIEEGTILYPDGTCKSDTPIQIVNRVRVIRDSEDEWVVDTTYTTYTEVSNSTTQTTTDSSSNADNQESDAKENGTTDADVVNTDYAAGNIVFADKTTSGTSYVYKEQNDSAPVVLLTVSGSMCGVIAVLLVALGLKKRKRQAS